MVDKFPYRWYLKVISLVYSVDAIIEGARTGEIGDGKIFVVELADCVRIRTGDRGDDAIG